MIMYVCVFIINIFKCVLNNLLTLRESTGNTKSFADKTILLGPLDKRFRNK